MSARVHRGFVSVTTRDGEVRLEERWSAYVDGHCLGYYRTEADAWARIASERGGAR